jgi:MinD superfamily P-loop ATPase
MAEEKDLDLIITDGPPGVGCPVIASIGGASAVLIVTEPTVSGRHDMERVAQLAAHFNVPAMMCVNKFDLNTEQASQIEAFATEKNVKVLGRIPFDPIFTNSMVLGQTIFEYNKGSESGKAIRLIWESVRKTLDLN